MTVDDNTVCKHWCAGEHDSDWIECDRNFVLYDVEHYASKGQVDGIDLEMQATLKANFSFVSPPPAEWMNLRAYQSWEDVSPLMLVELLNPHLRPDEPLAVMELDLQGMKDLHRSLGQVIEIFEG